MKTARYQVVWNIFITAFWIRVVWGFVAQEFFPPLEHAEMAIQMVFDLTLIGLGLYTLRSARDIGLLFVAPVMRYLVREPERRQFVEERFDRHLYVFLIIQAICLVWQFFKYGAGDHGGGSLGNFYSGICSTLIYIISFYLMHKRVDPADYFGSLWRNRSLILLLVPTLLNETKVSFVYLMMYFVLLLPINRRAFLRLVVSVPALLLLLTGAMMAYVSFTGGEAADAFSLEYYTEMYFYNDESEEYTKWLFDEDLWEAEDIPRFTKLQILTEVAEDHPGHSWLGFGVGHFKGHSGSVISASEFYKEYEWLILGTVPYLMHIWIQLGFAGIALVIAFFAANLRSTAYRNIDFNIAAYVYLNVVIIFFYNDSIRNALMMSVFCFIMFFGRPRDTLSSASHTPTE